ncbi:hypothetical protein [Devosia rhizoryzae]|uniref:Uncharacterized protein n=1 Tax=Devosia rhizoryzae TaxID=2774137 RepID=A0ABX7C8X5_9HYPH|nr:hypothetical protein [Devosia rhizoryzae]QQR39040.1 hypothetical protein JI748_15065 [Devosia rhizoryzae]
MATFPTHAKQTQATRRNLLPDTSVHPAVVAMPLVATAFFLLVCWLGFGSDSSFMELTAVTFIAVMFFGLMVGSAVMGRDMTPDHATGRSFAQFWNGSVDIATGLVKGKEVFLQAAVMPIGLAIGGAVIVIIAITH